MFKKLPVLLVTSLLGMSALQATEFESVAKILENNCVKCHNEEKDKGDLRLDTLAYSKKGGEVGPAIIPGDPGQSEVVLRIKLDADHDDIMPPKGEPLNSHEIQLIETWIAKGAPWPEGRSLKAPEEEKKVVVHQGPNDFKRVSSALSDEEFFRKEVFPIVDEHCYKCHGHDHHKMKADFWMASRMNILKGGSIGPVIDLDNPNQSEFLELIHGLDEDRIMPPKTTLTEREKGILTEWIHRGVPFAKDLEHVYVKQNEVNDENRKFWSFQPVTNEKPNEVKNKSWVQNDIDKYILANLEKEGLSPNEKADRVTLLRRAYYTLTGLPPEPQEVENFLNSNDPKAYEKIVDQLLASKHYGEKWGRHWLDLVRFAETNGYERDGTKPMAYRYRQWVIDAFNQDKPYDQMILEQLAGDELDQVNKETMIATGLYRLGIWDDEPADKDQAVLDEYDDMLKTTSEVFMGLTVGCAKCHDHKIDPIPQRDYYKMLSFFSNIQPFKRGNAVLTNIAEEHEKRKYDKVNEELSAKRAKLQVELRGYQEEFMKALEMNPVISDLKELKFKFYRDTWDQLPDFTMLRHEEEGVLKHNYVDISGASRETSFGYVFEGKLVVPATTTYRFRLSADDGARLTIDNKVVINHDGSHKLSQPVRGGQAHLREGELPFKLEYFQKVGDKGLTLSWSGKKVFEHKTLTLPKGKNLVRDIESLMLMDVGKNPVKKVQTIVKEKLGKEKAKRINEIYQALYDNRDKIYEDLALCVTEKKVVPDPTHIHARGSAHAKGPIVQPAFLSILPEVKPDIQATKKSSGRRLAMAKWLADPKHPLTARVMVNRLWQYHFGRGLVKSSNDFGFMGEAPTHPKLLDHLAHKFVNEENWSLKAMHKYILMSSTFQMSSRAKADHLAVDPINDHFWRYNMQRLTAEDIRDSILKVTGKLDKTYGGPSVYPKISQEVLAGQSRVTWKVDKANDPAHQFRRTIYTFNKRSLVLPFVEAMDGPTTDSSCAVRFVTTQPTQSLTMINSEFLRDAAKDFVELLKSEKHNDKSSLIHSVWKKVTGRTASDEVVREGLSFFKDIKASGASEDLALQQFCLIALNLNEFIYLD